MSYSKDIVVMAALLVAGTVLAGNTRYIGTGSWANSGTAPVYLPDTVIDASPAP